jgi:cell division protein FtsI/penicillin-binding protein 2
VLGRKKTRLLGKFFSEGRISVLALVVLIFGLLLIVRLFYLQVWRHPYYYSLAAERQEVNRDLFPVRGQIYTREKDELYPLVANREYYLLYAEPSKIQSPNKIIDGLTPILGLKEEEWKEMLTRLGKKDDPYEPLKHKITKKQADQIKDLNFEGLGFLPEPYRFYPEKSIGGHLFGFVSYNDNKSTGQYGLEGYFNDQLSGKPGLIKSIKDAVGSLITIGPRSIKNAENGSDLVLTVNREIQYTACQKLKQYYERFSAQSGTVIIMQPDGAILAMCSYPDFDPENYRETKDINIFNNPATFVAYEPGSVFKAYTMAAGLDSGAVTPQTTYEDTGEVKISNFTIKNSDLKAHGKQNMVDVLEHSLNTGAIFVEQKMGKDTFERYIRDLGFGKLTGITLDRESSGNLASLNKSGEIFGMTASYGQGITATPIQLVTAFAAIANQGKLPKPYIVSEIIKPNGEKEVFSPQVVKQVISPKAASMLAGMLTSVVERGYGKKAGVKGYYFAGKTGTAQIASPSGGYGAETNHTFIGFGPVSSPKFVMLMKLEKPKGPKFAEDTIVPLFHDLAEFMINYYQISPDY